MFFKKSFHITDNDKEWVHQTFHWLWESFGYPYLEWQTYLFTEEFFPNAIRNKQTAVEPLLTDLCHLFEIDPAIISFEMVGDISDTEGTPYEFQGDVFECELELITTEQGYHYKLHFAKALLKHPKRVVFNAVFQFIKINLSKGDIEWATADEDQYFTIFMVGIYTGWGVVLAQTMIDIGKDNDMVWETKWKYISPMPIPVMAYSLALYSGMLEIKNPSWLPYLPPEMKTQYERAVDYIAKDGNPFHHKQEFTSRVLFTEAAALQRNKEYEKAIDIWKKAILLTKDEYLKAMLYGNWGYTLQCHGAFEDSIPYFQKSLQLDAKAEYAYDNMAFGFIMMGDTDTGLYYHKLGEQTGNSVPGYTYRNLAMYHQKKGEPDKARENFEKALASITIPVDWLEYLYARFLYEQGEKEDAMRYLQMAIDKKEPQAIRWKEELNLLSP